MGHPQEQMAHGPVGPAAFPAGSGRAEEDADVPAPEEIAELLQEREQLKRAMETRPVIDMARGVLMASFGCQPEDAWEILVAVSQHSNVKLRVVAEAISEAVAGESMSAQLQDHLAAAVQAWRAGREPGSPG
ncbi:ANTAR domain-containing protein [Streptomyces sp. NPDC096013]|uniref:ANTAR domain-containing protein n=1 Tax=Streptomyces sp. NPDC096013 TaxID=3366069 RepID=UPI00381FBA7B